MSSKLPRLRFYIDENFPKSAGKFLKSLRQNVKFVTEIKKARHKSDLWQLQYAIKDQRILLVLDQDFRHQKYLLNMVRKSYGILLIQSSDPSASKVIRILKKVLKDITIRKINGKICIASVDKIKYIQP